MKKARTRLVTSRDDMRRELVRIRPTRIAVGYLGAAWRDLLGPGSSLSELVVSPRVGTNAQAVRDIAKKIGWENVHLLDQLHAKLYLGSRSLMMGSANLSANALGTGGEDLFELMMLTTDADLRRQAAVQFERYRELARKDYLTPESKENRLKVLERANATIREAREIDETARRRPPHITDFVPGKVRVVLEWWTGYESDGESDDRDYMNLRLHPKDDVNYGDWVLYWKATEKSGRPAKNLQLSWFRVDEIRRGIREDDAYPDQVAETHRPVPGSEPFNLDPVARSSIAEVLAGRRDLWPGEERVVRTPSRTVVDAFLAQVVERASAII